MNKIKLSSLDNVMYYILCVTTIGTAWFIKIIIRKALESNQPCDKNTCNCSDVK